MFYHVAVIIPRIKYYCNKNILHPCKNNLKYFLQSGYTYVTLEPKLRMEAQETGMKEPTICEYCGHEFYEYAYRNQKFCSDVCAISARQNYGHKKRNVILPVDIYFNDSHTSDTNEVSEVNAIASVISFEEFDDLYGIQDGEILTGGRYPTYKEMNKHLNELVVLFECPHHTTYTKHRHHPDYNKPLEIELLCRRCHQSRHKILRRDTFGSFNLSKRSLADKSVDDSSKPESLDVQPEAICGS